MIQTGKRYLLLLLATFFPALQLPAQNQAAKPNPQVDVVITQLSKLTHLPAEEWRYHAGDVPHGEEVALDDSDGMTVKPGSDAPQTAAWYRRWIVVPQTLNGYDLTGTKLWFQFLASANGSVPAIVYLNGRRVAMGQDLEPIILLDPVKPGDKVLIAVKLLPTVDKKRFNKADIRVEFAGNRPSPLDLLKEIETASALAPSLAGR